MLAAEGDEVGVVEVEVVYAADQGVHALGLEGRGEGPDQRGLAGALDAVEADDKGAVAMVRLEVLEDEGDAEGCLVVYKGGSHGGRVQGGGRVGAQEVFSMGGMVMTAAVSSVPRDVGGKCGGTGFSPIVGYFI